MCCLWEVISEVNQECSFTGNNILFRLNPELDHKLQNLFAEQLLRILISAGGCLVTVLWVVKSVSWTMKLVQACTALSPVSAWSPVIINDHTIWYRNWNPLSHSNATCNTSATNKGQWWKFELCNTSATNKAKWWKFELLAEVLFWHPEYDHWTK